ncbi:hypothetical protein GYMLUDRAFT_414651 [Collybiopsis luxurians FD-317 M1]|nr:hypothetical protein GYMLUDRAFT_414651 [Collybiopsis luxurians FD-317 M1]
MTQVNADTKQNLQEDSTVTSPEPPADDQRLNETVAGTIVGGEKKKKNSQELSTKVLAEIVESPIGTVYVHGGLSFGYECANFFHLNIQSWVPLPSRISQILHRSDESYFQHPYLPMKFFS